MGKSATHIINHYLKGNSPHTYLKGKSAHTQLEEG